MYQASQIIGVEGPGNYKSCQTSPALDIPGPSNSLNKSFALGVVRECTNSSQLLSEQGPETINQRAIGMHDGQ